MREFQIAPDPDDASLTRRVDGLDQDGRPVETAVTVERALTLYINSQEVVTVMTIGDYPDLLALGYLLNQDMLRADDEVTGVDFDDDLGVVIVRTATETNFEEKLARRTVTSGCAQGTVFGDVMEKFERVTLDPDARLRTSWIYALSRKINQRPSLYLTAGAIHGCVLAEEDRPLIYVEDVGRHNAIDKIAGFMFREGISARDKIFYTTGRLTSEMVIKCVQMEVPIVISRSGFTSSGVELARQAGLTLIGRAKGKRFLCLSGPERLIFDAASEDQADEDPRFERKGARA